MVEMFNNLLGIDLAAYHISNNVLYICLALVVLFVIGEMFNIVRTVLAYVFGKR